MDWSHSPSASVLQNFELDENLTSVLRHLLVSVEKGIERIEWSNVNKSWALDQCPVLSPLIAQVNDSVHRKDSSVQTSLEDDLRSAKKVDEVDDSVSELLRIELATRSQLATGLSKVPDLEKPRENSPVAPLASEEEFWSDSSLTESDMRKSTKSEEPSVASRDDDPDDGYHDNSLTQPTAIGQMESSVLHSKIALLPGSRDVKGRSVVLILMSAIKENPNIRPLEIAQLLMYYHSIPKKDIITSGFLVLVDTSGGTEKAWSFLDEVFCLLEANIPNAISAVLVWKRLGERIDIFNFPTSRVKFQVISSLDRLQRFIHKDQLLPEYGGLFVYDHQEWISFRKFLEPFVNGCRMSGRYLVKVMQDLRDSRVPSSAALTSQIIDQHKNQISQIFQEDQLRHLEEEGDMILKELESYHKKAPHNHDYRDSIEKCRALYGEFRKATSSLSKLAEKRLRKLQKCLHMKTFQEESSQVLSWLCRKGEEALKKHQAMAETFSAIKEQEEEFEKFYFVAMRQIERGNDLLEEAVTGNSPMSYKGIQASNVIEVTAPLKQHLDMFTEKLEDTRERIEDTAKCYHLLDKSYEWALETMQFVSHMKMDTSATLDGITKIMDHLQSYLLNHPAIADEVFEEMFELAKKLQNSRLLEQCQTAQARCYETAHLIRARQATLLKTKEHLELETKQRHNNHPLCKLEGNQSPKSHSEWTPHNTSTPFRPMSGSHTHLWRQSIAAVTPQVYSPSVGSYTAFPSSYYPVPGYKENFGLEQFSQHKEEEFLNQGFITEDLTKFGPVASVPCNSSETGGLHSARGSISDRSHIFDGKDVVLRAKCGASTSSIIHGSTHHRPIKKYMRRSLTWQMCEEALQKASTEVREQNAKLQLGRCVSLDSSNSSVTSVPEAEDSLGSRLQLSHSHSEPISNPVPVNSHLLSRASSALDLSELPIHKKSINDNRKSSRTLMMIMREMIQTERDYVKSLEYIIENYIPEFFHENIPQSLRGLRNVVFGNIEKIYEFHSQYFLQELEQCESSPFSVGQCFLCYEPQFYLYALYNKNKPKSDALMSEYGTAFFRRKQQELGDKMDLASYLLKPVQRMGKYALLLKQLLKECPERDADYQDLKAAEEMVRFQLRHGNDLLAMDTLRDCDVNVKEQGRLLRQDEFLVWQGRSRKSLRHVFLFEDLILFSKARRDPERKGYDVYQYKFSIKTTDIGLTEQVGESPTKFEIWFRKRKPHDTYSLQAPNPEVRNVWIQEISRLLWKQALRNREIRLAEMSSMGIGSKPCLDIKPSEDQISDRSINVHQLNRTPRFRNSIAVSCSDQLRTNKRPHSIISVSSSSSSGSSQSSFTAYASLNLGFDPRESPNSRHRSTTQQSQCSIESGFCTDISISGDGHVESENLKYNKEEQCDSLLSSDSSSSPSHSPSSPEEPHVIQENVQPSSET